MNKVIVIMAIAISLGGCGDPTMNMVAEYRTMSECVDWVQSAAGMQLNIITDKPDEVSGKFGDKYFGCNAKQSGTKGNYVEGYYTAD